MTKSPSENERRKQSRLEKLGTNSPICGLCGESKWNRIQIHHIEGQRRGDTVALICANCHCDVTDDQKDHPPFNLTADPMLDRIGYFLLGLADMLKRIVETLCEFGHYLIKQSATAPAADL